MNNRYYASLLDDAQTFIAMAARNMNEAKQILAEAGHPGVRLSADKVRQIAFKLADCQNAIDELPSSLAPTPPQHKQSGKEKR